MEESSMATEGTKFQINYKLSDGTLINLYAASVSELEAGLADISMNAANIKATGKELGVKYLAPAAPVAATVASVAAAFNATPVATPPGTGDACRHGNMTFKTGTSARGPWQGWMCAAPKGALDKCETRWVR
jgi:hypothetical protein